MNDDIREATPAETPATRRPVRDLRLLLVAGGLLLLLGVVVGLGAGRLAAATAAPHAATASKGTTATLTIRIKSSSGKLVKTLKGTTKTDQAVLTWNFNCALPKGQYRISAAVSGIACTP